MNVLTFKRVSLSLCVAFLKGSTMVEKTQITHHMHDPTQHQGLFNANTQPLYTTSYTWT